jgi:hypothetical protein
VGGTEVDESDARRWVSEYLDGRKWYGYPYYDKLNTGSDEFSLNDGDLLAPTLLNAAPSIRSFDGLCQLRPKLETALRAIPPDLDIITCSHDDLKLLQLLLPVEKPPWGVGGTMVAKVLHRKRPKFIPLYDSRVWHVYAEIGTHPLKRQGKRSWAEFFEQLGRQMRSDLLENLEFWEALATSDGRDLSLLRVLDIVVWSLGRGTDDEEDVAGT